MYSFRGIIYPNKASAAYVFQGVIILLEILFLLLSVRYLKINIVRGFFLLFLLNFSYYLIAEFYPYLFSNLSSINNNYYSTSLLGTVSSFSFTVLSFFPSFYLSKEKKITEKNMLVFFYVFFLIAVISYFSSYNIKTIERGTDEFTNNAGYGFIHLLPFLFLISKRKISLGILFISIVFIFMSFKRGAILIGVIFILYYLYQEYIKSRDGKYVKNLIMIAFLLIITSIVFLYIYSNNEYLQLRMEKTLQGDSSGRDTYFTQMWNAWSFEYNNIWNYLFGFGFLASVKITGLFAHNDWLELLTMSGLLGVFIYLSLFYQIVKPPFKNFLIERDKKILYSTLILWFLKTVFSMGYAISGTIPLFVLLGFIVGKYNRKNIIKR